MGPVATVGYQNSILASMIVKSRIVDFAYYMHDLTFLFFKTPTVSFYGEFAARCPTIVYDCI